jgi:hypothetical protein
VGTPTRVDVEVRRPSVSAALNDAIPRFEAESPSSPRDPAMTPAVEA